MTGAPSDRTLVVVDITESLFWSEQITIEVGQNVGIRGVALDGRGIPEMDQNIFIGVTQYEYNEFML